jgi:hypothetical protein
MPRIFGTLKAYSALESLTLELNKILKFSIYLILIFLLKYYLSLYFTIRV